MLFHFSAMPLAVQLFDLPHDLLTLTHCDQSRYGHDLFNAVEQAVQHAPRCVTAELHAFLCWTCLATVLASVVDPVQLCKGTGGQGSMHDPFRMMMQMHCLAVWKLSKPAGQQWRALWHDPQLPIPLRGMALTT